MRPLASKINHLTTAVLLCTTAKAGAQQLSVQLFLKTNFRIGKRPLTLSLSPQRGEGVRRTGVLGGDRLREQVKSVNQLSSKQRELVSSLAERLGAIRGIKAVVLGGSHARGRTRPESDIDLGLPYSETDPFSITTIRELAQEFNDTPGPVVTDFYGWGPWVNGGAWLTIGRQRVDFIYRNLEQVERVIADANAGRYELHYLQQPPFGFFSGTYLGEIAVCIPLFAARRIETAGPPCLLIYFSYERGPLRRRTSPASSTSERFPVSPRPSWNISRSP